MIAYILINKNNEFICQNYSKTYISKTDINYCKMYKYKKNAQKRLEDKEYWKYRNINIEDFFVLEINIIMDDINV